MRRTVAAGVVLAGLLAACGTAKRGEPVAGAFTPDDDQVRRGEVLFDRHCDKCHTGGEASMGPSINNKPLPEFLMQFQIRHGLGAMPGFEEDQISDADMEAITSYLESLRDHTDENPRR